MAVWSTVNYASTRTNSRLDAEYYQPKFLNYESQVAGRGGLLLDYVTDIIQPPEFIREYVPAWEGATFWRAQNVRRGYIDTENARNSTF